MALWQYFEYFDNVIRKTAELFYALGGERGYFCMAVEKARLPSALCRIFHGMVAIGGTFFPVSYVKTLTCWQGI